MAIISVTPVFQGEVVVNQVHVIAAENHSSSITPDDSQQENVPEPDTKNDSNNDTTPTTSTSTSGSIQTRQLRTQNSFETDSKKSNKSSNGSIGNVTSTATKQKRKLRRLGSRQSSKTESDSDNDTPNIVLEAPRRVKRKTSKTKRVTEVTAIADATDVSTLTSYCAQNPAEDIVYVLKIKPGQVIEQTEFTASDPRPHEDLTLMSSKETCIELIDGSVENVASNVFVKTKRKIFTPIDDKVGVAMVRDLESPGSSDRNDSDKLRFNCGGAKTVEEPSERIITNLPPLPQSPNGPRRLDQKGPPPKEPSPIIRHMIAKYNQRLSAERKTGSPHSSGSCSPVAWRSPVLERRVRQQTEKYLYQVTKSSSAGTVNKPSTKDSQPTAYEDDTLYKTTKSSSAGTLAENWPTKPEKHHLRQPDDDDDAEDDATCRMPLACDSLHRIHKKGATDKSTVDLDGNSKERIFRKHIVETYVVAAVAAAKTGAIRKISAKPPPLSLDKMDETLVRRSSEGTPDRSSNTMPKIKRKYDKKPPASGMKPLMDLNIRHPALSHSASTPISDRALKIRKAKEEFLRPDNLRACYCEGEEVWTKNRQCHISGGSESSIDECIITKSASAGMIAASALENAQMSGYESIPRSSMRNSESPGTSGGRFGFGSIASKLKRVKLRKSSSKELAKMNTVSRLCRQSLMVEIVPKKEKNNVMDAAAQSPKMSSKTNQKDVADVNTVGDSTELLQRRETQNNDHIRKSCSNSTGISSLLFRRTERAERLLKSKSIGQLQDDENRD